MAILVVSNPAWSQNSCGIEPRGNYTVINVKSDDPIGGLAVREAPSSSAGRRGVIPASGVGVSIGRCRTDGWCEVDYGCLSGWSLAARFLAPVMNRNYRVDGVSSSDPDGLNLRASPRPSSAINGHLRYDDTHVIVHACEASSEDHTDWCLVTSGRSMGWAAGRFLEPDRLSSPLPAPPPIISLGPGPSAPAPISGSDPGKTPQACQMYPDLC
jgi:uncharacterized protein YraI